ncbi:MAG: bifunctional adenosylcobinamide kinase/adenosylcobinamide-phosphate guanylyltransferase [Lachnospiraceae bacterium]
MVLFITGGSGSGKSEYAEMRSVELKKKQRELKLTYLATMKPMDEESKKRVLRHRKMRENKEFTTLECYTHLEKIQIENREIVLLECLSNLVANEMFSPKGRTHQVVPVIKEGITHLINHCKDVIIVGNNVFEDGMDYDEMTKSYVREMAQLHCFLGEQADEVIEVVCGIPIFWKGEKK